ncbi:MAG: hypothetical protein ACRDPE_23430 [Solirubrobacterales bacterium]
MPIEANPDVPEVDPQLDPATFDTGEIAESPQDNTPSPDWQAQYEKLRPEADRRASILSAIEGRDGPEAQAQALAQYAQIELQGDDPDPVVEDDTFNWTDPSEEVAQLRQELEAEKATAAQQQEMAQEAEYVQQTVAGLEAQANMELTDDEYELVVNYGLSHRDSFDGRPDLEGGLNALMASQKAAQKRYLASKQSVQVPTGSTGEPAIDYRDKDSRLKVAQEVFDANMAKQSQN